MQAVQPPDLTNEFQLADWSVHPAIGRISRKGEEVRLEPKVMKVLVMLAAQAGKVLSREALETGVWGDMIVGYDALPSSINKLRKALGDDSHSPRYIETVSKKGYRLIATISVASLSGQTEQTSAHVWYLKKNFVYLFSALLIGVGFAAYFFNYEQKAAINNPNLASEKRIAVLPFSNISGDPGQEYFVDGITDDLITDLSGLSNIVVISRTASIQYKDQEVDPVEVGKQLGADYFLAGSVRKSGKRWRINVKLINTVNGTNLWAKRFENTETSLFSAQDEVVKSIVAALAIKLNTQDKLRLNNRPTTNFAAYELFLQGQKLFKVRTKESNQDAQDSYRRAIELDPNFARAYGALAVALDVYYWRGWSESPAETLERALEMAHYATELDPGSPQAYWALAYALLYRKEHHKAELAVKRAIELAPNYADGYGLLALINNNLGNGKMALAYINKGMKLNPHYSWDYPYNRGRAHYILGEYLQSIKYLLVALERNENAVNPRMYLAAAYIAAGQKDDAIWEIEQLKVISPETTIQHLKNNIPIADKKLQRVFLDQLRQAGLPD